MNRCLVFVFPALVSAGLVGQDSRPGDQDEIRRYDVRGLVGGFTEPPTDFSFAEPPSWKQPPPPPFRPCMMGEDPEIVDGGTELAVWVLRWIFEHQTGPAHATRVRSDGVGWVQVNGPKAAHDLVPAAIAELLRVASQRIDVELLLLPKGALSRTTTTALDAAAADRLLEAAPPVSTVRAQLKPWTDTMMEAIERWVVLRDGRVQPAAAPTASSSRPRFVAGPVVPIGTRMTVRVDPMPWGDFLVTIRGQRTLLDGPVRAFLLKSKPDEAIQLPSLSFSAMSASARIFSGDALVVGTEDVSGSAWMVRARAAEVPGPFDGAALRLVENGLVEKGKRRFSFEVRWGVRASAAESESSIAETRPPRVEEVPTVLTTLTSGIAGARVAMKAGKSSLCLKDWDVEVGMDFICDPILEEVSTGASIWIGAVPGPDGQVHVYADIDYAEITGIERKTVRLGGECGVHYEIPHVASVTATVAADVTPGAWTLLRAAPIGTTGQRLVVMVRVNDG